MCVVRAGRLQMLAQDLHAREKEVNTLREKVRAELEAARQLAAEAAADHARLTVREKEVQQKEGQVAHGAAWKERAATEAERRLQVGDAPQIHPCSRARKHAGQVWVQNQQCRLWCGCRVKPCSLKFQLCCCSCWQDREARLADWQAELTAAQNELSNNTQRQKMEADMRIKVDVSKFSIDIDDSAWICCAQPQLCRPWAWLSLVPYGASFAAHLHYVWENLVKSMIPSGVGLSSEGSNCHTEKQQFELLFIELD